jgi:hypothetical protein
MLLGAIGTTIICAVAGPHGAAAEPAPIRATGFLVGADGLLLTAAQTVGNAQSALVTCPGQPVTASVVQVVRGLDLAVLTLPLDGLSYLSLNPEVSVDELTRVGTPVVILAYSFATTGPPQLRVHEGVVTAVSGPGDATDFLQLSMTPDDKDLAGAPAISSRGDVLGIMTSAAALRPYLAGTESIRGGGEPGHQGAARFDEAYDAGGFIRDEVLFGELWISHAGTPEQVRRAVWVLCEEGLDASWNGDEGTNICITPRWDAVVKEERVTALQRSIADH